MQQARKQVIFLLFVLLILSPVVGEITLRGVSMASTHPETWTKLSFTLENSGGQLAEVTLKVIVGPIEEASSFNTKLSIPPHCSWEMNCPVFVPPKNPSKKGIDQRKLEATVFLHQGGALLHREKILGALLRNNPIAFFSEKFKKPSDHWSVDGLWNQQEWLSHQGSVQPEFEKRPLRRKVADLSKPFLQNHFSKRIIVLESLDALGPLEASELLKWTEKGGLLILSATDPSPSVLHQILSFYPLQESWSTPGRESEPFESMIYHFDSPWKEWPQKGKTLGSWREFGHGSVLVTQVPLRELLVAKISKWSSITDQFMAPSPKQLWDESKGLEWMNQELLREIGPGMWSRNMVGVFLFSLLIIAISIAQTPPLKKRPEFRWFLWCGLSMLWCLGGFLFHLMNTDSSTRMESVEMVLRKVDTSDSQSWGLSHWRSGAKRRLDIHMKGIWWHLEGSQEANFQKDHWGLKNWELLPGMEKQLIWTQDGFQPPFEDPSLKIGIGPELNIPKEMVGEPATLIVGERVWEIDSLQPKQRLSSSDGISFDSYHGSFSKLFSHWVSAKKSNEGTSRPRAWLFVKNSKAKTSLPTPDNVKRKDLQWLWFVFPTSVKDEKRIRRWASNQSSIPFTSLATHLSLKQTQP